MLTLHIVVPVQYEQPVDPVRPTRPEIDLHPRPDRALVVGDPAGVGRGVERLVAVDRGREEG